MFGGARPGLRHSEPVACQSPAPVTVNTSNDAALQGASVSVMIATDTLETCPCGRKCKGKRGLKANQRACMGQFRA